MTVDKRDALRGQEADCLLECGEPQSTADCSDPTKPTGIRRPLAAIRRNCLSCCKGSALEVSLCRSLGCPSWTYRFGRRPTPDLLAEAGDHKMYPLEDPMTVAEFHRNGGTALKAIKRYCLDCSGGSKSEVRNCKCVACPLHPFRLGKNPNRRMRPNQREIAAARLRANRRRNEVSRN
jgi:hypothetical protein